MSSNRPRGKTILAPCTAVLLAVAAAGVGVAAAGKAAAAATSHVAVANRCAVLVSADDGRRVGIDGEGYRAGRREGVAFHLKPTGLRSYMLHDPGGRLMAAQPQDMVGRAEEPGERTEWALAQARGRAFTITSTHSRSRLGIEPATGRLILAEPGSAASTRFRVQRARGCRRYPEARVGARGRGLAGTRPDGTLLGFADAHLHVTANLRAGGRVVHGHSFHRFGIGEALGHDEDDHGPNGTLDVTGNLLREGSPIGTHDTDGWPTFTGWPVHDTITHQQAYYVWLERAWRAGLRLAVAQAVESQALCELEPLKSHSCDEMETVKLAIGELRGLERYVDAQSGGRGRGWLRIVTGPRQARRVIERGKLAVVIGMETSSPLGCSELLGSPQCTRAEVDSALDELHALGLRTMFVAHWIDNAFAGAALQSGAQGDFIGAFQLRTTGRPFETEPCGAGDEADGTCNAKGLTDLGRYLIRRMIAKGMLIEVDHLSPKAREAVLAIAERRGYPVVSSHTDTGGQWTEDQLSRLARIGGLASARPAVAPRLIERIERLRGAAARRLGRAVALGSDTGGFTSLPGPRDEGGPGLRYPFRSHDGRVRFVRQRSGERAYDLNSDGVAHYGLFADLIADAAQQRGSAPALRAFFRSAEAYVRMWELAQRRG